MQPAESKPGELDRVRSELRRLGYLSHGFERFLLQDALRPRRVGRTLLLLTGKVALLAGGALAFLLAFALAAANGNLTASPLDLLPLFLHLFPPLALVTGLGFLLLCGVVVLLLNLYHPRHMETLSLAAAAAGGVAALGANVWVVRNLWAEIPPWQLALLAVAIPTLVYLWIRVVHQGLLTLSIRLTQASPERRLFSRRFLGLGSVAALGLLSMLLVLVAARPEPTPVLPAIPTAPGERVVLVGIDGVLPAELDYLLALGELPAMSRLAREGGGVFSYRRELESPASFWTSVATGLPTARHGVSALDNFRPLGVSTPLARTGLLRLYWRGVEVPLGLAEYRAVLSNRRRAFTLWELASRGGEPILAVDWWATFPADPLPGLVVAHDAYPLLGLGAPGVVAPAAALPAVRAALAEVRKGVPPPPGEPALAAAGLLDSAVLPDRFYRRIFAERMGARPRAAALYLPGLDIAADRWQGSEAGFGDLVQAELLATDQLLAAALDGVGTVAVVIDPGRRRQEGGAEGRILLWRRQGCSRRATASPPRMAPEAVASGLLRALGLPQSAELPAPPADCRWPEPPALLRGYGQPRPRQPVAQEGGEYLKSLKALGYL